MNNRGEYQFSLVKKLSFSRFGGTKDEQKAADILMDEIKAAGGTGEFMEFPIPAFNTRICSLTVKAPFEKPMEVVPYGRSGSLPQGGQDLKLLYIERGAEEDYQGLPEDLSDTVLLINELEYETYERICRHRPAAFITIHGKDYDTPETTDLVPAALRDSFLECGRVPGFCIRAKDAMEMISCGASIVHLELMEEEHDHTSRNILTVIPGSEYPEESVVLTAHYDSVRVGTGSWDNATGAANLMYLYRYFLNHPPKRTMRFVWCGSEEQGLLGSKAYIAQHKELLESIRVCFNFDMNGTILGQNCIHVTGGSDLKDFVEHFCRETGFSAKIDVHVHSSDSAPFADQGIPAIGISRVTKFAEIHTRHDVITTLSAEEMQKIGDFSAQMISRIVNAVMIPVKKEMPEDMKEALDKYFLRDKKKQA